MLYPGLQEGNPDRSRLMCKFDLSVIIPSVNSYRDLKGAIAALETQDNIESVEIIVVDRLGEHVREQ